MTATSLPISSEEMLYRLQMLVTETKGMLGNCRIRIAGWSKADRKQYPHAEFNAAKNEEMAVRYTKDIAALEQAVALLEVLTHPSFERISHHWEACQPKFFSVVLLDSIGDHHGHPGNTVLEALLKAHATLQETKEEPSP